MGGGASPSTACCAMCWPTRKAVVSNRALVTNWPRPVARRWLTAARMPMTPNMPPAMSMTEDPARMGRPGGPVM